MEDKTKFTEDTKNSFKSKDEISQKEIEDMIVDFALIKYKNEAFLIYYNFCKFLFDKTTEYRQAVYCKKLVNLFKTYDDLYEKFKEKYEYAREMVILNVLSYMNIDKLKLHKIVKMSKLNLNKYKIIGIKKLHQ